MHGKGDLRTWVLQQTVGDGGAGTLKGFLARLEQQLDRSVGINKLCLARFEHTSRTKQRRRVHIVTASVHAAVGGCKGLAGFLGNGQGVHVATQHDDRTGLLIRADAIALGRGGTGADKAHNAGTIDERRQMGYPSRSGALEYTQRSAGGYCPARASGVNRVATQRARLQKPELLQQDRHR